MKKNLLLVAIAMLMNIFTVQAEGVGKYVGGDISMLPQYETGSSGYLDGNGNAISDLITWLTTECGWNTFRVRLFVNPQGVDNTGSEDPTVCQDLDYVKALGKRIKDAGANFVLDIHYSDTWVDATHIQAPSECSDMTVDEKAAWVETYTTNVLNTLKDYGAQPDMVQVGNEIMYGFMGIQVHPYSSSSDDWTGFLKVLKAGCDAVRTVTPSAKIIIHTDRPTNATYNKFYYQKLVDGNIDFDVIGLSFYPFWHGWINKSEDTNNYGNLETSLPTIHEAFPTKSIQIVETGYYFQYFPTSGTNCTSTSAWAASASGQFAYISDLLTRLANYDYVEGLYYWYPEDLGNGDYVDWTTGDGQVELSWSNRGLWWPSTTTSGHWPVSCDDGMIQYELKNFLATDTPSAGSDEDAVTNVNATETITNGKIYNMQGIQLQKKPQQGMYIQDNKKFIVR